MTATSSPTPADVDNRTAVVTTLFDYPDGTVEGRQTQVWVRFPVGRRIVSLHVSEIPMP